MPYHLLTGATGLLGGYLVRDLLQAGMNIAVLVRANRFSTARCRIEDLMQRWEREVGYDLPRPPVIEGDIAQENLGLDHADRRWVAEHCESVIHSAASLSFEENEKTGEPRRTNVEGTRNVLDICSETGIRQLHYVSTAYICGLRDGRVLESENNVGQTPSNAYEETKLEAEMMVRGAAFVENLTVFRPAIIIGDSKTGYTSTFHGFYTPLKIAHGVAAKLPPGVNLGTMLGPLGLAGNERKNFVPVDWISAVMSHVILNKKLHGATYHLSPGNTINVATMYEVIVAAIRQYSPPRSDSSEERFDVHEFTDLFRDQLAIYQAYWRDDPEFDIANTSRACAHLPCPDIDKPMLMRACKYAIEKNFGWPMEVPVDAEFNVQDSLIGIPSNGNVSSVDAQRVGMNITGEGGLQCTMCFDRNQILSKELGILSADDVIYMNSNTFRRILNAELMPEDAMRSGFVSVEGVQLPQEHLLNVLSVVFDRAAESFVP